MPVVSSRAFFPYSFVAGRSSDVRRMSAGGAIARSAASDESTCSSSSSSHELVRRRKLSFPASFHLNVLGSRTFTDINASSSTALFNNSSNSKRRFSHVGDAVSRKLSSTMGWKNQQIQTQDIVRQGKILCGQYIRSRLRRSRLLTKKCILQRIRSVTSMPPEGGSVVREVFQDMLKIGIELERMHPKVYTDIARQIKGGAYVGCSIVTEKIIQNILISVARFLFRNDVNWAKIVSLFAVAGGLACDCVRQNHVEYVPSIVETIGEVIELELAGWIVEAGGWIALQSYCRPDNVRMSMNRIYIFITTVMLSVGIFIFLIKWFGVFVGS